MLDFQLGQLLAALLRLLRLRCILLSDALYVGELLLTRFLQLCNSSLALFAGAFQIVVLLL